MVAIVQNPRAEGVARPSEPGLPACPVCGGRLVDIRSQLHCTRCHALCESTCDGERYCERE